MIYQLLKRILAWALQLFQNSGLAVSMVKRHNTGGNQFVCLILLDSEYDMANRIFDNGACKEQKDIDELPLMAFYDKSLRIINATDPDWQKYAKGDNM